jgi:hypothetical protein
MEEVCIDTRKAFSMLDVSDVLPDRRNDEADVATITLLHEVEEMRRKLRILEPQLSKAVTDFGKRRGWSGYREFHLRNALNQQQYTEQ